MSFQAYMFRKLAAKSDAKRNDATPHPQGVVCWHDLRYGPQGEHHQLNVYFPTGTRDALPTIVSIHGGGYVYGSKEVYHHYCADLARRGFSVVSFNYRLAPKWRFPAPLEDTNAVMEWLIQNAGEYHLDPDRVFLVGDSAGAQLASQYAAIWSDPAYASLFSFTVPAIRIRALGLNCGMYDIRSTVSKGITGLTADYLGKDFALPDPRLDVLGAIGPDYPPAHIISAPNDFLLVNAQPMADHLHTKGIAAECSIYGTPKQKHIGHVFHVDIRWPEATHANDDQCAFFRKYL